MIIVENDLQADALLFQEREKGPSNICSYCRVRHTEKVPDILSKIPLQKT